MVWNLVALAFAGMGAAGIAMILRMLSRKRLPKWIIPVFAGLGMLGYQIYMEYTALDLIKSRLPEGTVVIDTETDSMIWRPWTFVAPMKTAFTALDVAQAESRLLDTGEQVVRFVLYRFEKHHVTQARPLGYLMNCESREVVKLNEAGEPIATPAEQAARSNRVHELLCGL